MRTIYDMSRAERDARRQALRTRKQLEEQIQVMRADLILAAVALERVANGEVAFRCSVRDYARDIRNRLDWWADDGSDKITLQELRCDALGEVEQG